MTLTNHSSKPVPSATQHFTIIQADGLYPDDTFERQFFTPSSNLNSTYTISYHQCNLFPTGTESPRPWTELPQDLRDQVDGILTLKMYFTAEDLELFPRLKVIVRMGVGYDRLDRVALAKRGVTVCNVPDYGTCEVADHALALALTLRRGVLLHHAYQTASPPAPYMYIDSPLVQRVQKHTFGIVGLGRIGTAAALRAKAFGWDVLFFDPYAANGIDRALGVERTRDIKDLFRRSTTLSMHCPATRETRGMITYELLSSLPRGAVFVNTGRGETVDLDGLERCLKEGIISGAGVDVLPEEPIPEDNVHPLIQAYRRKERWLEGRMVLTCHTAFYSPESFEDIRRLSAETMKRNLVEGIAHNVITPQME